MPLTITPEVGIPLPFNVTPEEVKEFRERAKTAFNTVKKLIDSGAEVPDMGEKTSVQAHELFAKEKPIAIAKTPPAVVLKLEALLNQYDHEFLNANNRLANFVTNRLLEETENEDAGKRLKALELLGKRRGVNLFSEQYDVTIRQKPTEDIENRLNTILGKYIGDVETVEVKDEEPISPLEIDLDKELEEHSELEEQSKLEEQSELEEQSDAADTSGSDKEISTPA